MAGTRKYRDRETVLLSLERDLRKRMKMYMSGSETEFIQAAIEYYLTNNDWVAIPPRRSPAVPAGEQGSVEPYRVDDMRGIKIRRLGNKIAASV